MKTSPLLRRKSAPIARTTTRRPWLEALEGRVVPTVAEFIDPHPAPGNQFGSTVLALSTGNVVITSPFDDAGGTDAGAVYLFNGSTGALISTLIGSAANEQLGAYGVQALSTGNFLVMDPYWDNGAATDAGAVTFGSGVTGVTGIVSAANSLVGTTSGDVVGAWGITALSTGNYLVRSPYWDNGAATDAGAVTFGSGTTGVSGAVSAANSLVGSTASDQIGSFGVTVLSNGSYVVRSAGWDNGAATDAGAVTFGSGTTGVNGAVSAANSLVGSTASDGVGNVSVTVLRNGNYLVSSPNWDNGAATDAGAVTFGSGISGISGVVSAANSLVGSTAYDQIGGGPWYYSNRITELSNGNYLVSSPVWDNGASTDAGAVTFGNGTTGVVGIVSATNSLIGSTMDDRVGESGVIELSTGNYVVSSLVWDNGAATDAGAVTFGNGTTGVTGVVSSANSLVGSTSGDIVGFYVTALSNGNYVVSSPIWHNGSATNAGAVTFGSGTTGISGVVSSANSLVGTSTDDYVGDGNSVTELRNGNYLVNSRFWDNGAATDAGAVTFGSGTIGVSGVISAANSLVGSSPNDFVGNYSSVTALSNGNYVVTSSSWDNGAATDAGAVTFGNGTVGVSGVISAANSLVGSAAFDYVGYFYGVSALGNGNYVVTSPNWDDGAVADAGAATFCSGTVGVSGVISAANSLVGSSSGDQVGLSVTVLSNDNFVVNSSSWNNGPAAYAGAVTFGSGVTGVTGIVSAANSLVGTTSFDQVGAQGITALSSGNYLVKSLSWDNGAAANAGAVTFGNGTTGVSGVVSATNSLVGSSTGDMIASNYNSDGLLILSNGNYLIASPFWNNGTGAVTFGSAATGVRGVVSAANSLVGSTSGDGVGFYPAYSVNILSNGNYVVASWSWDDGAVTDAGAVTFGSGVSGVSGQISATNSKIGLVSGAGLLAPVNIDNVNNTFIAVFLYEGGGKVRIGSQSTGFAPDNTPPVFTSSTTANVAEGNIAVQMLTATDADLPAQTITFSIVGGADQAKFQIVGGNQLQFVASPNFETPLDSDTNNVYLVQIQADDGHGGIVTQTVSVTVTNVAPSTPTDGDAAANTVAEGAVNGTTVGITATSTDPNGPAVAFSLTDNAGGRFAIDASTGVVTVANGTLLNYETAVSHTIIVQASDGAGGTSTQTFTVTVTNVAPTANADAYTTSEGTPLVVASPGVLANDTEPGNDAITAVIVTGVSHGSLTFNSDGSFTYTPNANFNGIDSFTYKANDGTDDSNVVTVTLTVTPVNHAPTATAPPAVATAEDTVSSTFTLHGSDVETAEPNLTFTIATLPVGGTLLSGGSPVTLGQTFVGPPTLTYLPGTSGIDLASDSFTFTVTDRGDPDNLPAAPQGYAAPLTSSTATMSFTITRAVADATVTLADGVLRIGGTSGIDSITVTQSGTTITVTSPVLNPVTNVVATRTQTFTGVTSVRIFGRDGNDVINTGTVSLPVYVQAGAGNDTVFTGAGADTVYVGLGGDYLSTGAGNDAVFGNDGADTLYGGDGNDTLNGGAGTDFVYGQAGDDIFLVQGTEATSDRLNGGGGNDTLSLLADAVFSAFNASNLIKRVESNGHTIFGSTGTDALDFSSLTSVGGTLRVNGLGGTNTLTASLGNDVFDYDLLSTAGTQDTIKGFTQGSDRIGVSAFGSLQLVTGTPLPPAGVAGKIYAAASGTSDMLLLLPNGKRVLFKGVTLVALTTADFEGDVTPP